MSRDTSSSSSTVSSGAHESSEEASKPPGEPRCSDALKAATTLGVALKSRLLNLSPGCVLESPSGVPDFAAGTSTVDRHRPPTRHEESGRRNAHVRNDHHHHFEVYVGDDYNDDGEKRRSHSAEYHVWGAVSSSPRTSVVPLRQQQPEDRRYAGCVMLTICLFLLLLLLALCYLAFILLGTGPASTVPPPPSPRTRDTTSTTTSTSTTTTSTTTPSTTAPTLPSPSTTPKTTTTPTTTTPPTMTPPTPSTTTTTTLPPLLCSVGTIQAAIAPLVPPDKYCDILVFTHAHVDETADSLRAVANDKGFDVFKKACSEYMESTCGISFDARLLEPNMFTTTNVKQQLSDLKKSFRQFRLLLGNVRETNKVIVGVGYYYYNDSGAWAGVEGIATNVATDDVDVLVLINTVLSKPAEKECLTLPANAYQSLNPFTPTLASV
ncbi:hypothetical protein MTO96_009184 [Rhipicephalus appendiculatus]